jgi:hypothetical protein
MNEPRRYFAKWLRGELMSINKEEDFKPIEVKNGQVIRSNKSGTVRTILGAIKDLRKNK